MNITESRAAVAAAEQAFTSTVAQCAKLKFGVLAEWVITNLATHAVAPARARIAAGIQQLGYAPAAEVGESIHQSIVDAANGMAEICGRISDPQTMRTELARLYREIAPGSGDPFREPSDAFAGPQPVHPSVRAHAALQRWKARGLHVDIVGADGLRLSGDVNDGDRVDAAELKEHLLTLLQVASVTV